MNVKLLWVGAMAAAPLLTFAQQASSTNTAPKENAAVTQRTNSGIRGVLLKWPIRPSSRIGETNSAPMANASVSLKAGHDGPEIAHQKTDNNGRFEFRVPRGWYLIVPAFERGFRARTTVQSVEVKENQFTNVVVVCDTGIR